MRLVIDDISDDDQLPEPWLWKEKRNNKKIWDYTMTPGIREAALCQLGGSRRELDIFNLIFDDIFWENIVTETNRYADQIRANPRRTREIDDTWFPVDSNEIKRYFALSIIMAQVKKPRIQMNWSKRAVIETPIFRKSMPLKRYLQITRCLHFANNNLVANTDKLSKIKPVITEYNKGMNEIDLQDQILACFPVMRKYMKGYRIFYLFDIGLFNSYILCNKINNGKKQCYVDYRINIAEHYWRICQNRIIENEDNYLPEICQRDCTRSIGLIFQNTLTQQHQN